MLNTDIITPTHLSTNEYCITVNDPDETTLTKGQWLFILPVARILGIRA